MCTSFLLKGSDNGCVYGRTMEMGLPMRAQLTLIPRNYAKLGVGPDGKYGSGLAWTTKYSVVGMNVFEMPELADGMNEMGLVGGVQNFTSSAQFQKVSPADSAKSISSYQLLTYVLSNFATIEEVKVGLPKVLVCNVVLDAYKGQSVSMHYSFHDASGKSIVVEYLKGALIIYDNPTGAMANEPPFNEHLNNIGNYANLSNIEKPPVVIHGVSYDSPSSGNGLAGLPGDYLSPSRFIRAVFLTDSVPDEYTTEQMTNVAWHILGSFDIPPGAITLPPDNPYGGGAGGIEITEWSVVADNKNMIYNVRMYETMNIYTFDLKKADVNAKEITYLKLDKPQIPVIMN